MIGLHHDELRLEPHHAGWAALFEDYRSRILQVFPGRDLWVEHVGSTAVAGLVAKPVIDIAVSLPSDVSDAVCCTAFEQAGFEFRGDQGGEGGLLFVDAPTPEVSAAHIHVYRRDDTQWEATLCFRDLLRRDSAARLDYQNLKQYGLRQKMSRRAYLASKSDFIQARSAIFQDQLPLVHKIGDGRPPLPGIAPLSLSDWLMQDEAFDGQMALRDRLIAKRRDGVLQLSSDARDAAAETLAIVLKQLRQMPAYQVGKTEVVRPDRIVVPIMLDDPLATLGRLVQEDFCLMQKQDDEHILTGAIVCFPAGWLLADKFMRPLGLIHQPIDEYDDNIANRVQRMFDMMRPEQPLWRSNISKVFQCDGPTLFTPFDQAVRRPGRRTGVNYIRSERQSLVKLPDSGAVVFSIHTYLVPLANLTAEQRRAVTL